MAVASAKRVASLLASGTEIVCGLGLADQLVAISHECDHPPEVLNRPRVTSANVRSERSSAEIDDEVRSMTTKGEPLYRIDAATLVKLCPDVIITQSQCDVCAVRYEDVASLVRTEPALRNTRIVSQNPTRLEHLFEDIRAVADACEVTTAGGRYIATLRARVSSIANTTQEHSDRDRPRVACIEWIEPMMIAANWMPDLIEIAGGRSDLTRAGQHSGYADWNEVKEYDPEVIVVMPCGFDLPRTLKECGPLFSLPGWSQLNAVHTGRVFAADGNAYFNRSGPRMIDSLELLAEMIHPDRFPPMRENRSTCYRSLDASALKS